MITLGHYIVYILMACGAPHHVMVLDGTGKMWANDTPEARQVMAEARSRQDTEMRVFEAVAECLEEGQEAATFSM